MISEWLSTLTKLFLLRASFVELYLVSPSFHDGIVCFVCFFLFTAPTPERISFDIGTGLARLRLARLGPRFGPPQRQRRRRPATGVGKTAIRRRHLARRCTGSYTVFIFSLESSFTSSLSDFHGIFCVLFGFTGFYQGIRTYSDFEWC